MLKHLSFTFGKHSIAFAFGFDRAYGFEITFSGSKERHVEVSKGRRTVGFVAALSVFGSMVAGVQSAPPVQAAGSAATPQRTLPPGLSKNSEKLRTVPSQSSETPTGFGLGAAPTGKSVGAGARVEGQVAPPDGSSIGGSGRSLRERRRSQTEVDDPEAEVGAVETAPVTAPPARLPFPGTQGVRSPEKPRVTGPAGPVFGSDSEPGPATVVGSTTKVFELDTPTLPDLALDVDGNLTSAGSAVKVTLSDLDDPEGTVRVQTGGSEVALRPVGGGARVRPPRAARRTARLEGKRARWDKAFPDGSALVERPADGGVKGAVVLSKPPTGVTSWNFELILSEGLRPVFGNADGTVTDRSPIRVLDADGNFVAQVPSGNAIDANGASAVASLGLLRAKNGRWIVTVKVDSEWLRDPKRLYPVEVDPTINVISNDTGGHVVANSTASEPKKYVGGFQNPYNGSQVLESIFNSGAPISSATLRIRFGSCNQPWYFGSLSGNLANSPRARFFASPVSAPGYPQGEYVNVQVPHLQNYVVFDTGPARQFENENTIDITSWVQNWASGAWPYYGVLFEMAEDLPNMSCTVEMRTIIVNYATNTPATGTLASPSNGATQVQSVPTLTVNGSDAEGDPLKYYFRMCSPSFAVCQNPQESNTWLSTNSWTPPAALGSASTWQWQAWVWDGKTYYPADANGFVAAKGTPLGPWSFTAISTASPTITALVAPPLGGSNVALQPVLTGTASDPNGAALQYQFTVQCASACSYAPQTSAWLTTNSWTVPVAIPYGTRMVWNMTAKNAYGQTTSSLSDFTTALRPNNAPGIPVVSQPANGVTLVGNQASLLATATDPDGDPVSVQYTLCPPTGGCNPSSAFQTTAFATGALLYNTTYTWRAQARDAPPSTAQGSRIGALSGNFSFTTGPNPAQQTAPVAAAPLTGAGVSNKPILQVQSPAVPVAGVQYKFKICLGVNGLSNPSAQCAESGAWQASPHWQVDGMLDWNTQYQWTAWSSNSIDPTPTPMVTPQVVTVNVPTIDEPLAGVSGFNPYVEIDGGDAGGINEAVGQLTYSHTDVSLASVAPGLQVTRVYNGRYRTKGLFGRDWATSLDARVVYKTNFTSGLPPDTAPVQVVLPDGRREYFTRNANGAYVPGSPGFYNDLTREAVTNNFIYVLADRTRFIFNANGYLLRIEDRNGNRLDYIYSGDAALGTFQLDRIVDVKSNRYISFTYEAKKIKTISTPTIAAQSNTPQVTSYVYDGDQLKQVCPPQTASIVGCWSYEYSGERLVKIIKPKGNIEFQFGYDLNAFNLNAALNLANDPSIEDTTPGWGAIVGGPVTSVAAGTATDPAQYGSKYLKANFETGKLAGIVSNSFVAVEGGKVYSVSAWVRGDAATSAGDMLPYWQGFDANQNPIAGISGTGASQTSYSAEGPALKDGDTSPYLTSKSWTPIRGSFRTPENVKYVKLSFRWSTQTAPVYLDGVMLMKGDGASERVATRTDGSGNLTTYGYRFVGPNIEVRTTDPRPALTNGNPLPNGGVSLTVYNDKYQMISNADSAGRTTAYEYDAKGFVNKITDPAGRITTLTNDERGNPTVRTQTWIPRSEYWTYMVDTQGRKTNLVTEYRDARSSSATDNNFRTTYQYDAAGNRIKIIDPTDNVSTPTHAQSWDYYNGTEAAEGGGTVPKGALKSESDRSGRVTTYFYDSRGDIAKADDPEKGVVKYVTDEIGRRTSMTRYDGATAVATTTYTYDIRNRKTVVLGPPVLNTVTSVTHQMRTNMQYDANGNAWEITTADVTGGDATRTTQSAYDLNDRVTTIAQDLDTYTRFAYDQVGNRIRVTDARGVITRTEFDERNLPSKVAVENFFDVVGGPTRELVTATYTYDNLGRRETETDGVGRVTRADYWPDDRVKQTVRKNYLPFDVVPDVFPAATDVVMHTYNYDAVGNVTGESVGAQSVSRVFDARNFKTSETVGGTSLNRTTSFTYDFEGRPKTITTGRNVQTLDYWPASKLLKSRLQSGIATAEEYTYDTWGRLTDKKTPRGNVFNYSYNVADQPTAVQSPSVTVWSGDPLVSSTARPTVTTGYNTFGERTQSVDERLATTTWQYNVLGRLVQLTYPTNGTITPYEQFGYDANGNRTAHIDRMGSPELTAYDALGRVKTAKAAAPVADGPMPTTSYTYDNASQLTNTVDPNGVNTAQTWDNLGRRRTSSTTVRQKLINGAPVVWTSSFDYDVAGNLVRSRNPLKKDRTATFNTAGQMTSSTDEFGAKTDYTFEEPVGWPESINVASLRRTKFTYDDAGRKTKTEETNQAGTAIATEQWSFDADGNPKTHTRPNNAVDDVEYDQLGRVTRARTHLETQSVGPIYATATADYDIAGNLVRTTDPNLNATTMTWNPWGLLASTTEPATTQHPALADRKWTVGYNAAGWPTTETRPGNVSVSRGYDLLGRLKTEYAEGGSTYTALREFGYDPGSRMTSAGAQTFTYFDTGQLQSANGPSGNASFDIDAAGRTVSRTDTAGASTYEYNDRGDMNTYTTGGATVSQTWRLSGEIDEITYPAGTKRKFTYDDLGRPTNDQTTTSSTNTIIARRGYTYNPDSSLQSATIVQPGNSAAGTYGYKYDLGSRLIEYTAPSGAITTYEYDPAGNRSKVNGQLYVYDQRNRLTSGGGTTYQWTPRGTLASTTTGAVVANYSYDPLDRLKLANGVSYNYDDLNRITGRNGTDPFRYAGFETDPVWDGTSQYLRSPAGNLLAQTRAGTTTLLGTDRHGDVQWTLNPTTGNITDSTIGDPYGKPLASTGTKPTVGFQGDWTDPTTGLVWMAARWYNPATGTFVSRDTYAGEVGAYGTLNKYTYGLNNPLFYADPTGRRAIVGQDISIEGANRTAKQVAKTVAKYEAIAANQLVGVFTNGDPDGLASVDFYGGTHLASDAQDLKSLSIWAVRENLDFVAVDDHLSNRAKLEIGRLVLGPPISPTRSERQEEENDWQCGQRLIAISRGAHDGMTAQAICHIGREETAQMKPADAKAVIKEFGSVELMRAKVSFSANLGAALGDAFIFGGILTAESLVAPTPKIATTIPTDPLQTAIDEGRVKPGAPANHLNGALAEELGWRSSISNGEIGIQGPGKITATGPDYLTYDPVSDRVIVWDAKYSATGKSFPSGSSFTPPLSWNSEVSTAVSNYSGPGASQVQRAFSQGRVVGQYYKYP